jgi:hypothetical protein
VSAAVLAMGGIALAPPFGALGAWWLHRRSRLSPANLYLVAAGALVVLAATVAIGQNTAIIAAAATSSSGALAAATVGRRMRLAALGAGGELRDYELARRMIWHTGRRDGERTAIATQGELVRTRSWPTTEPFVPMTGAGRGRIPCHAGRHLLIAGATGAGKTVSARRWLLARILADGAAAVATDPKGDRDLEHDLRHAARLVGRPFVLLDPRDPNSDRWNPLWSHDTGAVVSRLVAPIAAGEGNARYYADLLQIHLGIVTAGLQAADLWPASMPLLLEAAQLSSYDALIALVKHACGPDAEITQRMRAHRAIIASPEGKRDLAGGTLRLRVTAGETWRRVLTPGPSGAITLPAALAAGAIVLLRTWVDDLPDEAKAITTLFLADTAAAALTLEPGQDWAALIDEFGGVLSTGAGERALALMQRARSAGGQVAVTTQSISDFAAATGNTALLDAMADNFAAGIFHRQASPESRDWLARLIGTRELWQSTERTSMSRSDGVGSRRRVREFLVRPDEFRTFAVGEAIVWTALGPPPEQIRVTPAALAETGAPPADTRGVYRPSGPITLPDAAAAAADTPDAPPERATAALDL